MSGSGESNHVFAGVVFLALVGGGAATGFKEALRHGREAPLRAHAAEEKATKEEMARAVSLGEEGHLEDAVRILKKIVAAEPENVDAIYNLGVAMGGLESFGDADHYLARVLELAPNDNDARAERATALVMLDRAAEAFTLLEAIPQGQGGLRERFTQDPRWEKLLRDPRMQPILARHGIAPPPPPAEAAPAAEAAPGQAAPAEGETVSPVAP